jgi:hypothetical protein
MRRDAKRLWPWLEKRTFHDRGRRECLLLTQQSDMGRWEDLDSLVLQGLHDNTA